MLHNKKITVLRCCIPLYLVGIIFFFNQHISLERKFYSQYDGRNASQQYRYQKDVYRLEVDDPGPFSVNANLPVAEQRAKVSGCERKDQQKGITLMFHLKRFWMFFFCPIPLPNWNLHELLRRKDGGQSFTNLCCKEYLHFWIKVWFITWFTIKKKKRTWNHL